MLALGYVHQVLVTKKQRETEEPLPSQNTAVVLLKLF